MKDIKLFISAILIIIAFFVGFFFSKKEEEKKLIKKENNYVNLEILKTKIKISKNPNTIITINGNIINDNIFDLTKKSK